MSRSLREVVFVDGVRTPFGKAGPKGIYAETRADDLVVRVREEQQRARRLRGLRRLAPRGAEAREQPGGRVVPRPSPLAPVRVARLPPCSRQVPPRRRSHAVRRRRQCTTLPARRRRHDGCGTRSLEAQRTGLGLAPRPGRISSCAVE